MTCAEYFSHIYFCYQPILTSTIYIYTPITGYRVSKIATEVPHKRTISCKVHLNSINFIRSFLSCICYSFLTYLFCLSSSRTIPLILPRSYACITRFTTCYYQNYSFPSSLKLPTFTQLTRPKEIDHHMINQAKYKQKEAQKPDQSKSCNL